MSSRTKMLLGVLAALILLSGWYLLPDSDSGVSAGTEGAPPGVAGATPRRAVAADAKKPVEYVEELRMADLVGQAKSFTPGRDPFRFFVPPPPPQPTPKPPTQAELDRIREAQERAAKAQADMLAAQRAADAIPKPAPFTMSYLGSFGPPERRLAVFTDGKTIYNAQEGEVLGQKFIVAHIGYESVDIQFVGFPNWPALRLAVGKPSR